MDDKIWEWVKTTLWLGAQGHRPIQRSGRKRLKKYGHTAYARRRRVINKTAAKARATTRRRDRGSSTRQRSGRSRNR